MSQQPYWLAYRSFCCSYKRIVIPFIMSQIFPSRIPLEAQILLVCGQEKLINIERLSQKLTLKSLEIRGYFVGHQERSQNLEKSNFDFLVNNLNITLMYLPSVQCNATQEQIVSSSRKMLPLYTIIGSPPHFTGCILPWRRKCKENLFFIYK